MSSKKIGKSAIEKIGEYKMEILNRVISSDKLSKLLYHDGQDALFFDGMNDEIRGSLLYDRVFPYRFVPEITSEAKTYLTLGLTGFSRLREGVNTYDDYQAGQVVFYAFTHESLMRTHSGVRQDLMIAEIDRLFEGTKGLGMGQLKLRGLTELWMHHNKFGGYAVNYTVTDLK